MEARITVVVLFAAAACAATAPEDIKELYVVWSNHFDAGFTLPLGTLANEYFSTFFPLSVNTSSSLRARGGEERYVWSTEAPWLVDFFLDAEFCEKSGFPPTFAKLQCPTSEQRLALLDEIGRGGVAWTAMPFSAEPEFYGAPSMFLAATDFVKRLDERVAALLGGIKARQHSAVFSQRDVPGLTAAAIPLLRSAGIRAVTVGVNGGSAPPGVPLNTPFVWRDPASGASLLAFWHPGGYAGYGPSDVVTVEGYSFALATVWKGDNLGPHTVKEVLSVYDALRKTFPNAKIISGTFDDFLKALETVPEDRLPLVTGEIGDTWIHGIEADPLRTAKFHAAIRLRAECIASGSSECSSANPNFVLFDRLLLKGGEHTFGVDTKMYLHDFVHWSNEDLAQHRATSLIFQNMEKTWVEQRQFIDNAVEVLGNSSVLAASIKKAWAQLRPAVPTPKLSGYSLVDDPATAVFKCSSATIGFDAATGAINRFTVPGGLELASSSRLLGAYRYQTFTEDDYNVFLSKYMYEQPPPVWAQLDFGKLGCNVAHPEHKEFGTRLKELWAKNDAGVCSFFVHSVLEEEAFTKYGAPHDVWVGFEVPSSSPKVDVQLMLFNKTSTRLPESHWFAFHPNVDARDGRLSVTKLGEQIDVLDILKNGSTHMHSIDTSSKRHVLFRNAENEISFCSQDAPLVFVGKDVSPFPVPLDVDTSSDKTIAFNLANNIWGTNYPMWYPFVPSAGDEDMLFRFSMAVNDA